MKHGLREVDSTILDYMRMKAANLFEEKLKI